MTNLGLYTTMINTISIYLPFLYRVASECEVKGMGEDKETLIISIGCVSLNGTCLLIKHLPVVTILQTGFHEDSILIGREICTAHDLTQEVDLRDIVGSDSSSWQVFLL